ncbi:MAG: oligosaccharide flippase family protein [Clostridia bacterium]|nr:oligosaccharide flippase family protein [Clostridia bacterium]
MGREKTLLKNTLIITIGKVCTQLITFFLLPLYTGILSTEEYGTVDLLNTLVSLLVPLITLQIEQGIYRELIEVRNDDEKKKIVISSGFFTIVIQCIMYLIFFLIISPLVNNNYKLFLATNVITFIFSSVFLQMSRGLGDNKKYTIGSFISAVFTIVFNVVFLVCIKLGARGMLLGTMLGQICCATYLFVFLKLYGYISIKKYKKDILIKLFKYSIPLIPNAISWWVFNASDRVIVSAFLGVSDNGILAAALKFSTVYITLYNIFNISWTESVALHIKDDDIEEYFNSMFNIVLKIFIAMAVGLITCMPFIYPIMINEKFSFGYNLVPILIISSLFNVVVGLVSVIYVANRNTKAIANTSVVSAICNIITHLCLIKYIGLYAAAMSTLISFLIMSIYRTSDISKKYIKIKLDKKMLIKTTAVVITILISYYVNVLYLNILSILLAILFAFDINRDSIGILIDFAKNKLLKIKR